MKDVPKLPENLVRMSVHSRLIARGDEGEDRALVDKKEGRMSRPSGENRDYDRRGRGRGRGGYDDRHGDRNRGGGRGGGRGGFETRQAAPEPVYDDAWRKEKDELQTRMNQQAAMNLEEAKKQKNDKQKVRLKLNQITPDNLDRKIAELREMLIGDRLLLSEPGFNPADAEGFTIDEEIL